MKIKTTLNVHKKTLQAIDKIAQATQESRNSVIVKALKFIMEDRYDLVKHNSRIKYQKADDQNCWNTVHVAFNEDMYFFCLDLRKLYRSSLSRILAIAISRKYRRIIKKSDNYLFNSYMLCEKVFESSVVWISTWGIPEKHPEYLLDIIPETQGG